MPTPLIELQRRLSPIGAIRAGGEKGEKTPGKKLDAWRITSPRKPLIEQAAELWGGKVQRWNGPDGQQWQVYTESPELPVLLLPSYSLVQHYELWEGATKRTIETEVEADKLREFWSPNVIGAKYKFKREVPTIVDGKFVTGQRATGTHASPRLHWRRGHYRNQAFGHQRKERKTIWIEPCLIGAE